MPTTEPFDKYVARYDAWFVNHRHAYASELRAVRSLMPQQGGGVEIGAGTGRFAVPLGIPLGVEPSRAMARVANARGLSTVGGVAEALPFPSKSFDFALMITTICFVDDVGAALAEAHRILRPGGSLIIGLMDLNSPLGRSYEERKSGSVFYETATFYSTGEITFHLDSAGFRRMAAVQTIFHKPIEMHHVEPSAVGWGKGGFVVMREIKMV